MLGRCFKQRSLGEISSAVMIVIGVCQNSINSRSSWREWYNRTGQISSAPEELFIANTWTPVEGSRISHVWGCAKACPLLHGAYASLMSPGSVNQISGSFTGHYNWTEFDGDYSVSVIALKLGSSPDWNLFFFLRYLTNISWFISTFSPKWQIKKGVNITNEALFFRTLEHRIRNMLEEGISAPFNNLLRQISALGNTVEANGTKIFIQFKGFDEFMCQSTGSLF